MTAADGRPAALGYDLEEMDALWNRAKKGEKHPASPKISHRSKDRGWEIYLLNVF